MVARIFDVVGWFTPVTLPAKLLLQEAWSLQVDRDKLLPEAIPKQLSFWLQELPAINEYAISRCVRPPSTQNLGISLHGYCEASYKAYGGLVYMRTVLTDTTVEVHLLTAKSKLAPLKPRTVPRLELCGAQLLSKLFSQVATNFDVPMESVYAWTDSAVVLGWLKTSPSRLKVYVSHRDGNILRKIPVHHRRYVNTNHNPADLASRGIAPKGLIDSKLLWSGPPWLSFHPGE